MNNDRRKQIAALRERIENLKSEAEAIHNDLEDIQNEEQDAFDNMPESLQESDRGQKSQEAIDALDSATGDLADLESTLDDVLAYLETAAD